MSYEPLVYIKSFNERLEDFSILNTSLKACEVKAVWSSYIELSMMHDSLQAIWKVSREFCYDKEICYPCTVVVHVEDVNAADLSCSVSIIEVEDSCTLFPEKVNDVPLIELYPTQEKDAPIAELLDSVRFFYNHLWMPWDLDFDYEENWVGSHLEGRLQLYFSMLERSIPLDIAYSVHQLKFDARRAANQLLEVQEAAGKSAMDVEEMDPCEALKLVKLHNTLQDLRNQYRIYETPLLLKALINSRNNDEKLQPKYDMYLVLPVTTCEHLIKYSKLIEPLASANETMGIVQTLQDALRKASPGNSVFVSKGEHHINDQSALETCATIIGLETGVVLTGRCGLNVNKGLLTVSLITVRLTDNLTVIKVRPEAECRLEDVTMVGSHAIDGVDVYSNATFTAVNCLFHDFDTPLICDSQSTIKLVNCTFKSNKVALKLKEGANFTMENCTFSESKLFAIFVTVPRPILEGRTDDITINSIPNMKETKTSFINNKEDLHFVPQLLTMSDDMILM